MTLCAMCTQNGADIAISNVRGDTPLHSAARWNHPRIVNELVLYGAQFLITNNEGKTPLDLTKVWPKVNAHSSHWKVLQS